MKGIIIYLVLFTVLLFGAMKLAENWGHTIATERNNVQQILDKLEGN